MTLRTREQDIRRDRATSNICTNEALLALASAIHLTALGPVGLREVAELCIQKSHYAAARFAEVPGVGTPLKRPFVKEFVLHLDTRRPVQDVCRALWHRGILAGYALDRSYPELPNTLLVCVTEKRTKQEIDDYASSLRRIMEGVEQ